MAVLCQPYAGLNPSLKPGWSPAVGSLLMHKVFIGVPSIHSALCVLWGEDNPSPESRLTLPAMLPLPSLGLTLPKTLCASTRLR